MQAWWVECHFTYISRAINLFFPFLAVTDFDHCARLDPSVGECVSGSVHEKKHTGLELSGSKRLQSLTENKDKRIVV